MQDLLQFGLLFCAIAIGWWLGRRGRVEGNQAASKLDDSSGQLSRSYYKGLNYLLNDEPDAAIDSFVDALEVNSDTLETHLAVGNLLRRRGEVERSIRVHQNLLARPSLPARYQEQVHLELAKDYISAGLLDRAERMLLDLANGSERYREQALKRLLQIYQKERDWESAIDTAQKLLPRGAWLRPGAVHGDSKLKRSLAHYCCELAEKALAKRDYRKVRSALRRAESFERYNPRACILAARVELATGNGKLALRHIKRLLGQSPELACEVMDLLDAIYAQLDTSAEARSGYLAELYVDAQSTAVLLSWVEAVESARGVEAALQLLSEELRKRPTLKGLSALVRSHHKGVSSPEAAENLGILRGMLNEVLRQKFSHQCGHCGFSGNAMHWLCPSCKSWGEIAPLRGVEGD